MIYASKLEQIADALAERIKGAPVFAAEDAEVISRVDDKISSQIEEKVGKAGGLLTTVALTSIQATETGAAGPRVRVNWVVTIFSRRAIREGKNSGMTLLEALLARVQGWLPAQDGLCYDEFALVSAEQIPSAKYSIMRAVFSSTTTLRAPVLVLPPDDEEES